MGHLSNHFSKHLYQECILLNPTKVIKCFNNKSKISEFFSCKRQLRETLN